MSRFNAVLLDWPDQHSICVSESRSLFSAAVLILLIMRVSISFSVVFRRAIDCYVLTFLYDFFCDFWMTIIQACLNLSEKCLSIQLAFMMTAMICVSGCFMTLRKQFEMVSEPDALCADLLCRVWLIFSAFVLFKMSTACTKESEASLSRWDWLNPSFLIGQVCLRCHSGLP